MIIARMLSLVFAYMAGVSRASSDNLDWTIAFVTLAAILFTINESIVAKDEHKDMPLW